MTTTLLDRLAGEYVAARPKSAALHDAAVGFFPAQGATHSARAAVPFRPYIVRAQGARKWDVDGHEYLDYVMGHGALILGHGHPAIVSAVQEQVERGIHYGDNHPLEVEWAGLIREMMPVAERVSFFACGQEANLMGIRLSRLHTGRKGVLRIRANFHGWADELSGPAGPGTMAEHVKLTEPNDLAGLEKELATKEYAIVMVEGGGAFLAGRIPMDSEFYQAIPGLARKYGTVFLLDEVVTGFREAPGGWQSIVGIKPDLTSLGKAVSGGLPAGSLIGRPEIFTPLDPATEPARLVVQGGTWNAVPMTCAAGIAALNLYRDGAPHRTARERGEQLVAGANDVFVELAVPARCHGRSIVHLVFEGGDTGRAMVPGQASRRLDLHLLHRGVASFRAEEFVLSAAHTAADVELTVEALRASLMAMREEGSLP
jgi:glutamate-1-semialdehyde 2,1-aminomutase